MNDSEAVTANAFQSSVLENTWQRGPSTPTAVFIGHAASHPDNMFEERAPENVQVTMSLETAGGQHMACPPPAVAYNVPTVGTGVDSVDGSRVAAGSRVEETTAGGSRVEAGGGVGRRSRGGAPTGALLSRLKL